MPTTVHSARANRVETVETRSPGPSVLRSMFAPLSLAAYAVMGLLAYNQLLLRSPEPERLVGCAISLGVFLLAFVLREFVEQGGARIRGGSRVLLAVQVIAALVNLYLLHDGMSAILLVLIAAQSPMLMTMRSAVVLMLSLNLLLYIFLSQVHELTRPLFHVAVMGSFQAFALLMGHFAYRAERSNTELAVVNAHLLATRSLLAEGVRNGERLRLSRELHDVAGHSLTALKLHLELAQRLPDEEQRRLRIAAAMALIDSLLDDIRGVVGQLRRHDGIDLPSALSTLCAGYPGVEIRLQVAPDIRVADVERAEAILRVVQEGLTNAIRHGAARAVDVRLALRADALDVEIEDRGRGADTLREGNGLTGMRERLDSLGGSLHIQSRNGYGTRLAASLPSGTGPAR